MKLLTNTLIRSLNEDKKTILEILEKKGSINYTVRLHEDEGELLITLLMTSEQIEDAVVEAVSKVFPDKGGFDIHFANEYISFTII